MRRKVALRDADGKGEIQPCNDGVKCNAAGEPRFPAS
jgi:hypothetical protein